MSIVFLNGDFMPAEQAQISPMDRGFLFGDGVYEVIPSHQGKMVGFGLHMQRLINSLQVIDLPLDWSAEEWRAVLQNLLQKNGAGDLLIYLQVSRGTYATRQHAFPNPTKPTVFAYCFDTAAETKPDKNAVVGLKICSALDKRWQRCHVKSTSLLGNILHLQHGKQQSCDEVLLYDEQHLLNEGTTSNVFIVKQQQVITPPLTNRLLAGVTRQIALDALAAASILEVVERPISLQEARQADEIWLTNSSREIAPVITLDDKPVGSGKVGNIWLLAQSAFNQYKYDY